MKIKRYIAADMQQAMIKIKQDMGNNAIILNTKRIKKGGLLGLFAKSMIEVTAASDFQNDLFRKKENEHLSLKDAGFKTTYQPNKDGDYDKSSPLGYRIKESQTFTGYNYKKSDEIEELRQELNELKEMLRYLTKTGGMSYDEQIARNIGALDEVYQTLIQNEVEPDIAKRLIEKTADRLNGKDLKDKVKIKNEIKGEISNKIKDTFLKVKKNNRQIMAFIGPTGVGKTTSIAKLAANFALCENRRVGLITADTYRIAAVEQLKTYAEIMEVPLEVIYTPDEMKRALDLYESFDTILIDTAGTSSRNKMQINELKNLLEAIPLTDTFLVLSATTRNKDLIEVIDNYSIIKTNRILFTKLDETSTYGCLLNVINYTNNALSYITIGQSVPEDIEEADPDRIASLVLGEYAYGRSGK
ncbi:MAG: flagellar biosynthesis protein FlhF [Thermosediminibacterales bacterium]|nr:flagellar biosynthesis protein FlhF [Thermosediminibacterales bacterium]